MINQVKVVSILMIVQGSLESLMGLLYLAMGPLLMAMRPAFNSSKMPLGGDEFLTFATWLYVILGALVLTTGVLNIIAGVRAIHHRSRTFVIVALFMNVIPLITIYCAPTALGVMIYGLIVFFNREVAYAFQLVAAGKSPDDYAMDPLRYDALPESHFTPPPRAESGEGHFR
jgi:hypothetical protein